MGVVFLLCGEFLHLGAAFYRSAVRYTSLGGDVVMSHRGLLQHLDDHMRLGT